MNSLVLPIFVFLLCTPYICTVPIADQTEEAVVHFGFHLENGQTRDENITYNMTAAKTEEENDVEKPVEKSVEYRGGYSFISDDGYEYMVKYKANKNGFQPYVTARKIKIIKSEELSKTTKKQ